MWKWEICLSLTVRRQFSGIVWWRAVRITGQKSRDLSCLLPAVPRKACDNLASLHLTTFRSISRNFFELHSFQHFERVYFLSIFWKYRLYFGGLKTLLNKELIIIFNILTWSRYQTPAKCMYELWIVIVRTRALVSRRFNTWGFHNLIISGFEQHVTQNWSSVGSKIFLVLFDLQNMCMLILNQKSCENCQYNWLTPVFYFQQNLQFKNLWSNLFNLKLCPKIVFNNTPQQTKLCENHTSCSLNSFPTFQWWGCYSWRVMSEQLVNQHT